ncbi:unnamed protein product [Caenorhabditis brenneri]
MILDELVKLIESGDDEKVVLKHVILRTLPVDDEKAKTMATNLKRNLCNIMSTQFNHLDNLTKAGILKMTHTKVAPNFEEIMKDTIVVGEDRCIKWIKTREGARDKQDVRIVVMSRKEKESTPTLRPPPRTPSTETPTMEGTQCYSVPDKINESDLRAALQKLDLKEIRISNLNEKQMTNQKKPEIPQYEGLFLTFQLDRLQNLSKEHLVVEFANASRILLGEESPKMSEIVKEKLVSSSTKQKLKKEKWVITVELYYEMVRDLVLDSLPSKPNDSYILVMLLVEKFEELQEKYHFMMNENAKNIWMKLKLKYLDYPNFVSRSAIEKMYFFLLERL